MTVATNQGTRADRKTATIDADPVRWRVRGACAGHAQPELWYPERQAGQANHGAEAKAICRGCEVRVPCLVASVELDEGFGIHGGAGEDLRRWLRRAFVTDGAESGPVWTSAMAQHFARLDDPLSVKPIDRNGPEATHGRRVTHARGCRCGLCTAAAGIGDAGPWPSLAELAARFEAVAA